MTRDKPIRCECGNDIRVVMKPKKKSRKVVRQGEKMQLKDHDLCQACWVALVRSTEGRTS